jgi:hypothetical protein
MAPKSKPKKKTKSAKSTARAKTAARSAKRSQPAKGTGGADETSEVLRASAKSFAARLLR